MTIALLDVNVLLALAWPNHMHHAASKAWFDREALHGWSTCALTQLSFVRLSANPAFTPNPVSPEEAARILRHNLTHPNHVFWDAAPACEPEIFRHAIGHQQVTDAWLVEVARQNGGYLATLDRRLKILDPTGKIVEVISPTI